MARGNGRNSPVIGDNGITATPAELSNLTNFAVQLIREKEPDLHNLDEVKAAVYAYFKNCEDHGLRPGNLGLYAALGMSKQDYHDVVNGKNKSKVSPDCIDFIKKAARAVGVYREGLAMTGKINPVTYIFMGKNYDNLSDTQQIEITANNGPAANMTPDQIAAQIETDIPIDTEYTIDNSQ